VSPTNSFSFRWTYLLKVCQWNNFFVFTLKSGKGPFIYIIKWHQHGLSANNKQWRTHTNVYLLLGGYHTNTTVCKRQPVIKTLPSDLNVSLLQTLPLFKVNDRCHLVVQSNVPMGKSLHMVKSISSITFSWPYHL